MSKKHFIQIAKIVSQIENPEKRHEQAEFQASLCEKMNPRFDRARFFAACGVK